MKLGSDVLWLSEKDVRSLLTMKEALRAMEEAFRLHGQGKAQLPSKIYLIFPVGDLRAMPGYLKSKPEAAGVKIVNSNPVNPSRGLPAVAGIMVFVDPNTGMARGVFGAGTLTAVRTGAAGALAAKLLARKDSRVVGLVGCGRQAQTQLEGLLEVFKIKLVKVWGVTLEESRGFIERNRKLGISMIPCVAVPDACQADIIVTTTPARKPVLKKAWIRPGTHINAIGADAPGKQELETALIKASRVVVDEWEQASHAGEINVPVTKKHFSKKDLVGELGEIITRRKTGRRRPSDITVFDSTGLAIQDVAVSNLLFHKAIRLKKGQVLKLHG